MSTDKFKSSTIFELQQELLRVRKQFTSKQSQWKRERISLIQKNEIINMELVQMKHRQMNLKKINETLQLAQYQKKSDSVSDLVTQINRLGISRKDEKQVKNQMQQEYRIKQQRLKQTHQKIIQQLKQEHQKELQDQLMNQQTIIRRKLSYQLTKLESENQNLRSQINDLSSQLHHSNSQLSHLRQQIEITSNPVNSFRSSSSNRFMNFINSSKQVNHINTSTIVNEILCEVCGDVFPSNDFFQHIQQCQQEEQENYQQLLNRKMHIQNQLEILDYKEATTKPNKIIMIVNDTSRRSKKEKPFSKSYKESPSNSFIQSSIKSSIRRF